METQTIILQEDLQNSNPFSGLDNKEILLAKEVYHLGQLRYSPLTDIQIKDYAISLNSLFPNLKLEILKRVINKMKLGEAGYKYDSQRGITTLCIAIKGEVILNRNNGKILQV